MPSPSYPFVPLHVKSHHSLGVGTTPVERLATRAAALGLPAATLTDLETLQGQVELHRCARERGLRPLTGVELREVPGRPAGPRNGRAVLLARDREGYENLCRIITRRRLGTAWRGAPLRDTDSAAGDAGDAIETGETGETGDPIPPADPAPGGDVPGSIAGLARGLLLLTDSPAIAHRLLDETGAERRDVGLLLVRPRPAVPERDVRSAAARLSLPLVADPDVVVLDPEDHELHRLLVAIHHGKLLAEVGEEGLVEPPARHLPGPREAGRLFADAPHALRTSRDLAERCELDLRAEQPVFPRLELSEEETPASRLSGLCIRGLRERHGGLRPQALERLAAELRVIQELGFCEYFLIVGDIIRFARERDIEVVGRGSAAGSLVTWSLGITNVDPIEHRLHFERFLHPSRRDLPDIDVDICWIRRDEVLAYVYERYGHDRVAMISTHITCQPRSALRETLRALGVPPLEANRWSAALPQLYEEVSSASPLRDLLASSPAARGLPTDDEPFRSGLPLAERLLGCPRHLSVHPGGIVIGDRPIDHYVPLQRAAKGVVVTQYEKDAIEDIGLVKIDLLGSRCLTEIQETLEWVRASGREIELRDVPDHDPAAIELLRSARTVGCFQLESPAMRGLLRKMAPRDIRGCIAAVALIRPGAAAGGAKETYVRRAHGEEPVDYLHPALRDLLEENLGTVIYEEDVMCIASAVAGVSRAEGDTLRSALKKCASPEDLTDLEDEFLRRAVANGVEPSTARRIWEDLRRFASYCFSKAHAAGYGVLAYQSAWLKAHFPVEFACAILNHHAGMYSTRTIAEEVKRTGVEILPPCVQRSEEAFTVERSAGGTARVRTGLARVKGLSTASRRRLIEHRPFRGLIDCIRRTAIPRRELEALILAGGFDAAIPGAADGPDAGDGRPNRPQLLWELESAHRGERGQGQLGFLEHEVARLDYPPLEEHPPWRRLRDELRVLGLHLADHPVRWLRARLRELARAPHADPTIRAAAGALPCSEAPRRVGRRVRVLGLLAATRRLRTARGEPMQFLTIEDEHDLLEGTLFPPACRQHASRLRRLGPYLFEGVLEEDHRAVSLNIHRVTLLHDLLEPSPTQDR